MKDTDSSRAAASDEGVAAGRAGTAAAGQPSFDELEWHRAETERLRVLIDFLARPIHAPGGADPDPDVLTAYNLAIEAALQGIRRAASGRTPRPPG
jgi:hypothetical protein